MTKRKNSRQKHQKEVSFADTSDEELTAEPPGKSCQHVIRAIHFGRVKKALKSAQSILSCSSCSSENSGEEAPEVWLCLQCGHRGCGRASEEKHALQHYKTIHSDCHSLVLSTSSGIVWCYDCDDAVNVLSSRILKQCVDFVMKSSISVPEKSILSNENKDDLNHVEDIKEEKSLQCLENSQENMKSVKNLKETSKKTSIKGLRNLGNTCFFNAVMQNLNQTPLLIHELTNACTPSHVWEIPELDVVDNEVVTVENAENLKLNLPKQMQLTNTLYNFFNQMQARGSSKTEVVNPSDLFSEISKKCPQFRHFQQQDSHELLRQLLDNVRLEEIKRQKKALLRYLGLENVIPDKVDDYTKERVKAYRSYASHTIIEKVFGGLLISTVLCEECKVSSQIFEPFMDLSLPLFEEKPVRNRKSDEDDDSHVDFVLPKTKYDPGKISKHQEKKQKQLARKERKKNKNANKNKKLPLTSFEENETHASPEPIIENDQPTTIQAASEDKSPEKSQNEEKLSETDSIKVNFESSTDERSFADFKHIDDDDEADFPAIGNLSLENSYHSEEGQGSLNKMHTNIDDDIETQISIDALRDNLVETVSSPDDKSKEMFNKDSCIPVPLETNSAVKEFEGLPDTKPNSSDQSHKSDDSLPEQSTSMSDLSRDLSGSLITPNSGETNVDDQIQALSMQIKDVRIRRDSDRQEILLTSSDSEEESRSQRTRCTSSKSSVEEPCKNESEDTWSHSVSEKQTKEWILKSLTTLKPRHNASAMECSIRSSLSHFTKPELLTGNNKFRCENCTEMKVKKTGNRKDVVYTNASKQILIFSPPAILTLHLKRFQQVGMSLRKVNRFVEFPLILDLAPFCSSACVILPHMSSVENEILYSLYGIVEHSGRLSSGHYTAYVKCNKKTAKTIFECLVPLGQSNLDQLLHRFSGFRRPSHTQNCEQTEEEKSQWFYMSDSHFREVSEAQVLKCQAYLLFYERIK